MAKSTDSAHDDPVIDRERIGDHIQETRAIASDMYQAAKGRAVKWEGAFEKSITDNPIRSVLIATGVGLLLGICLSKR